MKSFFKAGTVGVQQANPETDLEVCQNTLTFAFLEHV